MRDARRRIPSVESVLSSHESGRLLAREPRSLVADAVAAVQDRVRAALADGEPVRPEYERVAWYASEAARELAALREASLRRVLNATGVILHTNLGRAPLARAALDAMVEAARGYSNLEYQLEDGARGSRYAHCVALLRRLSGAADALVVNNNAAALVLALNTAARGRSVLLSRGELVEIGGSFRIPEIIERSGVLLHEVGTTNRTYIDDYAAALDAASGAILKVHPSNFRVVGFTTDVPAAELAMLAVRAGVPFIHDLGSGLLVEPAALGLPASEPTVRAAVAAGPAVVTFSGDKLLGGPQAGIIVGDAGVLARMRANPLCRAMRVDKLTLAALEATLRHALDPRDAIRQIPVLRMIAEPLDVVDARAQRLAGLLSAAGARASVVASEAVVGGGAFPDAAIASRAVAIDAPPTALAERLRAGSPPLVGRVVDERLLLDARTLADDEIDAAAGCVLTALRVGAGA
jgi:L-seryl-tRNA(Ser) seleniumtransferase